VDVVVLGWCSSVSLCSVPPSPSDGIQKSVAAPKEAADGAAARLWAAADDALAVVR
jgi:hypothetical protein